MAPIVTGHMGTNAELFPVIFEMYVPKGSVVADVTYGKGDLTERLTLIQT